MRSRRLRSRNPLISFLLCFALLALAGGFIFGTGWPEKMADSSQGKTPVQSSGRVRAQSDRPVPTVHFSKQSPASVKPVLTWSKVEGAVAYEIRLFAENPVNTDKNGLQPVPFFTTTQIYVNGFNADLSRDFAGEYFYWQVRGLDIDGKPIGLFSDAEKVDISRQVAVLEKPTPTSILNQKTGVTLLYPVYSWIPVAGADKYEIEILDDLPENPNGIAPSIHRIEAAVAGGFDYYDEAPRISEKPLYWRVRGLDQAGNPVGVYSDAGEFGANPHRHMALATFGDSITHGGGGVSYSPADLEYSYQHYLDFPTINLGKSGDTSQTLVERFERDVLPFKPQYLLILAGTNSLRGGVTAQSVIADLKVLREKCLANGIQPVFLTLPPINPDNIKRIFNEETAPDWREQMQLVNDFIRTQEHIDVAKEMEYASGILPTKLAVDGLHLDIKGKKKIAAVINANWARIAHSPRQSRNEG
jgi:lysophospholipase L1-like esterase